MSLGMGDEAPIVHDIRWPISSLAKIAGSYRARRGDPLTPSPHAGESQGERWPNSPRFVISPRPLGGEGQGEGVNSYQTIPGFCKSAKLADNRKHDHVLTPGRYVGAEAADDDDEPFDEKMKRPSPELTKQPAEGAKLDEAMRAKLVTLGFPMENEP